MFPLSYLFVALLRKLKSELAVLCETDWFTGV